MALIVTFDALINCMRYSFIFCGFCFLLACVSTLDLWAQEYISVAERSREAAKGNGGNKEITKTEPGEKQPEAVSKGQAQGASAGKPAPPEPSRKKQQIYYPDSRMKKQYRVAVIAPLFLDELVRGESVTFKEKVPEKAAAGLAFYQGMKLAADSLARAGVTMDIDVFDAGSFDQSPEMLIERRRFDSTDLIIGAVEQHDIPVLATFAKKKKINFVSALINYDGWVKDNQYFTMLQPSLKSHCEYIIDELSDKYPGQHVAMLYRTNSLTDDNAALYILNDLYSDVTFRKLNCNTLPSPELLAGVLDSTRPNVLVMSISDAQFADSILQLLSRHFQGTHFEIYGMPGWHRNTNLSKSGMYKNLTVNVTYPFDFSHVESPVMERVNAAFGKEFGGVPTEMMWRGYEAMLWYGSLLKNYGTIFNDSYKDLSGAPFTKFRIKPRWDRNGNLLYFENNNIYQTTYQGGAHSTR